MTLPSDSPSTVAASVPADSPSLALAHALAIDKARRNIGALAERPLSGAFAANGDYFECREGFFEIGNWTSSFFTGMALLAFEATQETELLRQLDRLSQPYRDKVTKHRRDTMHDLGFLYSLYSVGMYRITGSLEHRSTGLLAAEELAKRFRTAGRYIQAWGPIDDHNNEYAGLAIIDCMMNLPLLFWSFRESDNQDHCAIAVAHADTTLQYFLRADDSICHAFRFDLNTGSPIGQENYCGFAPTSHWARGTAWAIYGFALAYRYTSDARYLQASSRLACKFAALLDAEDVPVWDFRLPASASGLRDSSAAAIAVCGIDELVSNRFDADLAGTADRMLRRLCTDRYLDHSMNCRGLLKHAEVGDGPGEIPGTLKPQNVYASWGDYYFMEALSRRLLGTIGYW